MKKYDKDFFISLLFIGIFYLLKDSLYDWYLIPYFITIFLGFDISSQFRYNIDVNKLKIRAAYKEILIRLSILYVPLFIYVFFNYSLLLLGLVVQGVLLIVVLILLFNKRDATRAGVSAYILLMVLRITVDKIHRMDLIDWLEQLVLVFALAIIIYVIYVLTCDLKERKKEKC